MECLHPIHSFRGAWYVFDEGLTKGSQASRICLVLFWDFVNEKEKED